MKSRRRIAFTKAGTTTNGTRLQQGFATGEMGFNDQFALQKSGVADVRFGSIADIHTYSADVCFTPKSGHRNSFAECPLSVKRGYSLVMLMFTSDKVLLWPH
jgi:hypothetical protein